MPLKLTCPNCGRPNALAEPLPQAGEQLQCVCGQPILVTWPPGTMEKLKARGMRFREDAPKRAPVSVVVENFESTPNPPGPRSASTFNDGPDAGPKRPVAPPPPPPRTEAGTQVPTRIDATLVAADAPTYGLGDKTVPSARTPYGALALNLPEPDSDKPIPKLPGPDHDLGDPVTMADLKTEELEPKWTPPPQKAPPPPPAKPAPKATPPGAPTTPRKRSAVGCMARLGALGMPAIAALLCTGVAGAGGGYVYFSQDLPSVEALQAYEPATSTMIYDKDGDLLGELYEERRYVVPLEKIPAHVQDAFIAAEDANFHEHGGVDYMGLVRAVYRNVASGKKAQGASTITQQVTRNFLLTREKTVTRKIKEILLAWRIEGVYDKEHILYLYLNEIYLGSGAYGVEAAARVYFDKSATELTLAEAAMIAGLPPAPSQYSPHKNFTLAKERQAYVLEQMVKTGKIDQAAADEAYKVDLRIVDRSSDFLQKSPHFTEYVRRYLVDKYGEDKVLHGGLQVHTTLDLDLQQVAQTALTNHVHKIDQWTGFQRANLVTLPDDAAIDKKRADDEAAMRSKWARDQDPAGRVPEPPRSHLEPDHEYEAVVLEVKTKWIRVGIGVHEAIIPAAWSDWVYEPNLWRPWKRTPEIIDFLVQVDGDGDGKKDGALVRKGDVVLVKVEALSTKGKDVAKAFVGTPGEKSDLVAATMWQDPTIEAAMMSFDLDTGAVRALVGGADFKESQFIRPTQAKRQVGSTFKPIVYGAAIDTKRITAGSMVTDAPLAFGTDQDFVWKPGNFGGEYMGNITLRMALSASKNSCTVRVIETIDPGMNQDIVYQFARKLGIGGPPKHELPADYVPSPDNDHLCPWTKEEKDSTICMDHFPPRTDKGVSNTMHRAKLAPEDEHFCRTCDYSMALGSPSLTMEELMRAYTPFGTAGKLVQPYYIEDVTDRHGNVLEKHDVKPFPEVIDPGVATVTNWLLQGVVYEGTAHEVGKAGFVAAGKTGTTNDNKDVWFVGMTPEIITAVWVGYDQPRMIGGNATGGRLSVPIWIEYMNVAAKDEANKKPFRSGGEIEWAPIDEKTGMRVTGGRQYPFLKDTVPEDTGASVGQATLLDPTDI